MMPVEADEDEDMDYTQSGKEITPVNPQRKGLGASYRTDIPLKKIEEKVYELLRLPENWNSYGATKIRQDVGFFSIYLMASLTRSDMPVPNVVPMNNGGIQLEWHQNQADLEIAIEEPYKVEYWFYDHRNNSEFSGEIAGDFNKLEPYIARLSTLK